LPEVIFSDKYGETTSMGGEQKQQTTIKGRSEKLSKLDRFI
jgi:hypothetical protein